MSDDGIKHGTYSGYQKHKRLRVKPCAECREANRAYHAGYRADPSTRRREREQKRLREAALTLLMRRHRVEYRRILQDLQRQAEDLRSS